MKKINSSKTICLFQKELAGKKNYSISIMLRLVPVIFKYKFFCICLLILIIFSKTNFVFSLTIDEYSKNIFGDVLFIRHSIAPGFGDPKNFDLKDCSTQRNLNQDGRDQAFIIGEKIKAAGIKFSKIFSSQWCRCLETGKYLNLGDVILEPGLNSFFQGIVSKEKTLSKLRKKIRSFESKKELILMITHQVTISAITGITVSSGGAVAFNSISGESKEVRIFD